MTEKEIEGASDLKRLMDELVKMADKVAPREAMQ